MQINCPRCIILKIGKSIQVPNNFWRCIITFFMLAPKHHHAFTRIITGYKLVLREISLIITSTRKKKLITHLHLKRSNYYELRCKNNMAHIKLNTIGILCQQYFCNKTHVRTIKSKLNNLSLCTYKLEEPYMLYISSLRTWHFINAPTGQPLPHILQNAFLLHAIKASGRGSRGL